MLDQGCVPIERMPKRGGTAGTDGGGAYAYELGEVDSGGVGGWRCKEKAWDL